MKPQMYLPISSMMEILGILTILTNKTSLIGPAPLDIGLSIPIVLISADVQGIGILLLGTGLTTYTVFQLSD